MTRFALVGICALLLALVGCDSAPTSVEPLRSESTEASAVQEAWFELATQSSGIDFSHHSGAQSGNYYYPESMGSGLALCDFDGDGDLDIYFVQSGSLTPGAGQTESSGNRMYFNDGHGHFSDVTVVSATGDTGYGMGAACADIDNDGDIDLYVNNVGRNVLYRNTGAGVFVDDSSESGVDHPGWAVSSVFFDADRDGDLDLFVANYIDWSISSEQTCTTVAGQREYCGPGNYRAPARDVFYRNRGDGRYIDASVEAGLATAFGNGMGVVAGDFNQDGNSDVYVANDQGANQLWLGDGSGRFRDDGLVSGTAFNRAGQAEAGMGVLAVDVDHDADLDLLVTHLRGETNTLYLSQADAGLPGVFSDETAVSGLGAASRPYTGFGLGLADFDQDGHLDLYVANGRVTRGLPLYGDDPYAEPDLLFRGRRDGGFDRIEQDQSMVATGRGAAFGDIDGDLDIDVIVSNRDGPPLVLLNTAASGHAISFRVLGRPGTAAIGANIELHTADGMQWRRVQGGDGYASSSAAPIHFGLGQASEVTYVVVHWPDQSSSRFGPFAANKTYSLAKPD